MKTKKYCPYCGDFEIYRINRSFIEKNLFKIDEKYMCKACDHTFSRRKMDKNESVFKTDNDLDQTA